MSTLNQSGDEPVECPLCLEPLEVDDLNFYPCTCGYQICRFCWNRIREGENGLCPACRKAYPENPADFTPLSREQVAAIKTEKRTREQRRRNKTLESRRQLANVRVVQKNLVFVVGLPVRLADPEVLKKQEYFGKYGKIHKVVINQSTAYAGAQLNGPSASAYVTYTTSADALRAIQSVNNVTIDGRVLKGSLGTTKYCANFMKNQPCPKVDCMYLHDLGDPKASFTKEEMHQGLHQVYERKLHNQLLASMAYGGSNSTNGSNSNNSNSNSNTPVPVSSSITILNNKSKKDSGQSNSSVSSQCSSGSGGSLSGVNLATNNGQMMNGSREAWPSLSSSPDHKHNTSPTNLQNHSPEPEYRNSQSDTGDSSLDKDMPSDDLRENYMSEDNMPRNNTADRPSVFRPFSTRSAHRDSINDNDSLIDSDEHRLLEDDTHSLLESSHNHASLLSHQPSRQLGPAFPTDASRLSHVLSQRPKFNSTLLDYELLLRQQRHLTDVLSQQQQLSKTQPSDPHSLNSHYSATDVMQKFFSEFSLGQQMKQQNVTSPPHHQPETQNSLPQLPADVPTHAFIESQHLQRRYGQNVRSNGHVPQMNHNQQQQMPQISQIEQLQLSQMNQLNQLRQMMNMQMGNSAGQIPNLSALSSLTAQMSNLTAQISGMSAPQRRPGQDSRPPEDDLDFDPFKESQKAFADLIENEVSHHRNNSGMGLPHHGMQQNGVTNFNSSMLRGPPSAMAPPPGFHSHMNAFGLGVPRPQQNNMASSPQSAQGPPNIGTDWTQMDPAIVSTSVSQPQPQDLFSRFANLSMAKQSALHNGQGPPGVQQQLQGRSDLALNVNGMNGHYGAPQQQKIWQGYAPNGASVNRRSFYGAEGPNKAVMTSVPPGFNLPINTAPIQNSNVSKNTECIESK